MPAILTVRNNAGYDLRITLLMFTILVSGCIAGQNLLNMFGHSIASGMFIFPLTFPLIASITELYGFRYARSIIWMSVFCNVLMAFLIFLFTKLPSSRAYVGDPIVYHVFCNRLSYLIIISTCAYLISEYTNAWILSKLRVLTHGKFLILRALASTSTAIIIDTWLIFPAFLSRQRVLNIAFEETCINMLVKISYEIVLLPLFWLLVAYVRHKEKFSYQDCLPECAALFSCVHYLKSDDNFSVK